MVTTASDIKCSKLVKKTLAIRRKVYPTNNSLYYMLAAS